MRYMHWSWLQLQELPMTRFEALVEIAQEDADAAEVK